MKEKIQRDGRRRRRAAALRQVKNHELPDLSGTPSWTAGERRYVLTTQEGRHYALFDPEEVLKVGRHEGELGIVYTVKKQPGIRHDEDWHVYRGKFTERGLIRRWKKESGVDGLIAEALLQAAKMSGAGTKAVTAAILKKALDGGWGTRTFWEDLASRYGLGLDIQLVREVMES